MFLTELQAALTGSTGGSNQKNIKNNFGLRRDVLAAFYLNTGTAWGMTVFEVDVKNLIKTH